MWRQGKIETERIGGGDRQRDKQGEWAEAGTGGTDKIKTSREGAQPNTAMCTAFSQNRAMMVYNYVHIFSCRASRVGDLQVTSCDLRKIRARAAAMRPHCRYLATDRQLKLYIPSRMLSTACFFNTVQPTTERDQTTGKDGKPRIKYSATRAAKIPRLHANIHAPTATKKAVVRKQKHPRRGHRTAATKHKTQTNRGGT